MPSRKQTSRKPSTSGSALDDVERDYRELVLFAESADGFQLALATYDVPARRDALIQQATQELSPQRMLVSRLDLSRSPTEIHLLECLARHLRITPVPLDQRHVVMIIGIEATLDYSAEENDGLAILQNANAQRDSFSDGCPVPVIFWLSLMATSAFAKHAPDLWHWRTGSFDLTGAPELLDRFERSLVSTPVLATEALSRARKQERVALLQDLLLKLESSGDSDSPSVRSRRANLLSELGIAYSVLAETRRAIEFHEQALEIVRQIGDRHAEGVVVGNLGVAYADLGEPRRAIEFYEQQLEIALEIADRRGEATVLNNLGSAYADLGEPHRAIESYEQQLGIAREIGDRYGEGQTLGNLGIAYADLGEPRRAIEFYEQYLEIARAIGDRRGEGNALGNLGIVYATLGEPRRAIEFYEQQLEIVREIGDRRAEAKASWNLGDELAKAGDTSRAVERMQVCVDYEREIGHPDAERHAAHVAELRRQLDSK